ncbi:MAG: mannitol dehydrogenase family protein [Clostridia bacterium]|nr:mannitol dehydrogenase family protein [Clostridia bacterium]
MKMNRAALADKAAWEKAGVRLPQYDVEAMVRRTKENPIWVHFGAGNIFRGFIAALQQRLLNQGLADRGIIAADTFDYDIITKIYDAFDNLTMNVTLNPDATTSREIIASVAEGLRADAKDAGQMARFGEIFENPSLQMVSFTITEKGYALRNMAGELMPVVTADMKEGPDSARHAMSVVTALLLRRFKAGAYPLALVSMDNCSHNGEKLRASVMDIADAWRQNGFVGEDFIAYLGDEERVAFPWSMIDKITPRPAKSVEESLLADGIEEMSPIVTGRGTFIAPFVNAERPQYLVVEDRFPNGRPALEQAGVYMTDRDTVNCTERMKVTTCLNPLHTALAVYGCMLGYTLICEEMKDEDLVKLVKRLGYVEGLPVVVDPKILSPKAFIDEVVGERLPNPFMPDAPQRIATDTSQKVGIRYGETIKSYVAEGRDLGELIAIPLAIAGWLRYLLGVDDEGKAMEISADPMKEELRGKLAGIEAGKPETYKGQLREILKNKVIFGSDLCEIGLAERIEEMFVSELAGPGAVRATLRTYLA